MVPPTTTPNPAQVNSSDNASPVWSDQPQGSEQTVLASVLAHLEADRATRLQELSKSEERFKRLEEWLGRLAGGIDRPHVEGPVVSRPHVEGSGERPVPVPVQVQHGIGAGLLQRSGLPSRRERSASSAPPPRANDDGEGSLGSEGNSLDREEGIDEVLIMPSISKKLAVWLKNAQKVTSATVTPIYTGQYWDLWKVKMTMALREAKLIKFISSSFVPPLRDPASLEWHQFSEGDPMAKRFILKHLDEERGHELAFLQSATEMWDHLLATEESRTLNDVRRMVSEWEALKQLPSETMSQFICRIDLLAARLMEVNRIKDQDDKLYKLLDGMGPHWDAQKAAFEVTANIQTYKEVCAILLGIAIQRGEVAGDIAVGGEAHFTMGANGAKVKPPKKAWEQGKSALFCSACGSREHHTSNCPKFTLERDANGRYPKVCFRCHKPNHVSRDCPERAQNSQK